MKSADGRFEYQDKDGDPLPEGATLAQVGRFGFECRSGTTQCSVNIRAAGYDVPNKNWTLTGTVDKPTLTPSINCRDCWHGFIENGVFVKVDKTPEIEQ